MEWEHQGYLYKEMRYIGQTLNNGKYSKIYETDTEPSLKQDVTVSSIINMPTKQYTTQAQLGTMQDLSESYCILHGCHIVLNKGQFT